MNISEGLEKIKSVAGVTLTPQQKKAIDTLLADFNTMKNKVEKLLAVAAPEEQTSLRILYNAVVKNANVCNSDPSKANLMDWRESQKELDVEVEKLQEKYDIQSSGKSGTNEGTLSSMKEILAYLHGCGYQLSQSGLYKHRDEGKFKKDKKTGRYLVKTLDKYAKDNLPLAETGKKAALENDALYNQKLKLDIREREARATKAEKELAILDHKYIEREVMERELVAKALVIDSEGRHMIKTSIPAIIELVGGDASMAPQAIEVLLAKFDKMMHTFSSTTDFVVNLEIEREER